MLSAKTVKIWYVTHKWTSLICTAFLLMLCVTGLPLIFYHELSHLLWEEIEPVSMPPGTPNASLDSIVEAGLNRYPDEFVRFLIWDQDEPDLVYLTLVPSLNAPPDVFRSLAVDARTAEVLAEPKFTEGVMYFILKLHTDMFAGPYGMLFLGFMGLLFVVSLVSGAVVYFPFMRKLDFGIVRKDGTARIKWLDLHNLLGIVTLMWVFVVGGTGVINTLSDVVIKAWQFGQLAEMTAPYKGKPLPQKFASLDKAMDVAREAVPGMTPEFVAFPGSPFSSNHHYAVFMSGTTPLTSRLLRPALIDAETGELTDSRYMPWYVAALLISQPLHFGDYGGMPMKVVWAVLDVITIVVLASGLYLWLTRRKKPIEERIAELEIEESGSRTIAAGRPVG
ncbi:MAG: PepSY domain-containing protein [Thermodesulfobacteriota bacterium]